MGKPIAIEKEDQIKRLLRGGVKVTAIAQQTGCSRQTIRNIRKGRTVVREPPPPVHPPSQQPTFKPVRPYKCKACSQSMGYVVSVAFRPCVACAARKELATKVASTTN